MNPQDRHSTTLHIFRPKGRRVYVLFFSMVEDPAKADRAEARYRKAGWLVTRTDHKSEAQVLRDMIRAQSLKAKKAAVAKRVQAKRDLIAKVKRRLSQ